MVHSLWGNDFLGLARVPYDRSNECAKHRLEKHVHFSFLLSGAFLLLVLGKGGAKQGCTRHDVLKNVHNLYNLQNMYVIRSKHV